MTKTSTLLFVLIGLPVFATAQEASVKQTTIQPNGVVVYEAAGVEGFPEPVLQQQSGKQVSELNLAECIDASRIITKKLEKAAAESNEQEVLRYQAALAEIEARKKQLIQSGN